MMRPLLAERILPNVLASVRLAVKRGSRRSVVIPGHGNVTNKAGLMTYRNNVDKLRNRVSGLIREGKTQDDIAKVMTTEYGWQPNSLQQQWSVPGFMKEFK